MAHNDEKNAAGGGRFTYQILSDIHIERDYPKVPDLEKFIECKSDTLIIAGDVGRLSGIAYFDQYITFMAKIQESAFKRVILVLGNHEYMTSRQAGAAPVDVGEYLFARLHVVLGGFPKITLLQDSYVDIATGGGNSNIRIYGTTLWSYIPDEARVIDGKAVELPIMTFNNRWVEASWFNREHARCVYSLELAITKAKQEGKRMIVVSHYAPTMLKTLDDEHLEDPMHAWYASNLDRLLTGDQVYVWIFGHTHVNCAYLTKGDTFLVSNQYRAKAGGGNGGVMSMRMPQG